KVDEFQFARQDYNGTAMRMDGYYNNFELDSQGDSAYQYKIFYKNGVCINLGTTNVRKLEESFIDGTYLNSLHNKRYGWGIYSIREDSTLIVQYWFPRHECKDGAIVLSSTWKIKNDSTIKLISGSNNPIKDYNELHFKSFLPKPDSTNGFIN